MDSEPQTRSGKPSALGPAGALAVFGEILLAGPIFGLLGTVVAMVFAFDKLSVGASTDPKDLAHDIGFALYAMAIGLLASLIGFV